MQVLRFFAENFNFRKPVRLIGLLLLFCIIFQYYYSSNSPTVKYFVEACKIFDNRGRLLYQLGLPGDCAFLPNGNILHNHEDFGSLKLFDKLDNKIWHTNALAHHGVSYNSDADEILLKTNEFIDYAGKRVRSDCFLVLGIDSKRKKKWCLGDHIDELKMHGINFYEKSVTSHPQNLGDFPMLEVSHANSFYEIPQNSSDNPAFAAGNYIVNVREYPGLLLIFDKELVKIVDYIDFERIKYGGLEADLAVHDAQITSDGSILFYLNYLSLSTRYEAIFSMAVDQLNFHLPGYSVRMNDLDFDVGRYSKNAYWMGGPMGGRWYSQIVRYRPQDKTISRVYPNVEEPQMRLPRGGSVNKVANQGLFFNINHGAVEINAEGRKLQEIPLEQHYGPGQEDFPIMFVQPLGNEGSFLRSRGLID